MCSVDGCNESILARGFCRNHYRKFRRNGTPHGDRRGYVSRKPFVKYGAMHMRLREAFGSASNYSCVECGGQAAHWAYDHADPHELKEQIAGSECPYSLNAAHYNAMCVPCHKAMDVAIINGVNPSSKGESNMALPKPQKSKGSAPTQPAGGYQSSSTSVDPCCIPVATPSNTSWSGSDSSGGKPATDHIKTPTAH